MNVVGPLVLLCCIIGGYSSQLEVLNQWTLLNFDLPFEYSYEDIRLENTVFTGFEVTSNRIFLATPRLRVGVPATLSTIPRNTPPGSSPVLQAFPDWSMHGAVRGDVNCTGLISVYRIRADSCNRLWVLDSGVMTSLDDFTRVCNPKLMVFDLRTDQIVRTVIFPREVLRPSSLLTNLIIDEDVQGRCDSAFVYMSDTASPGLVVYDGLKDQAWRIMHPAFFPDPDFSDYNVDGESFTLMDGVVGLAHSPTLSTLYFQPLATDRLFSIPTSALTKGPPVEFEQMPVSLVGKKSSQGLGLTISLTDDTLYFSPLTETAVATWNPVTGQQRLLAYDSEKLQFPAELRWLNDGSVWLLSTRFQKFFKRTIISSEINLRIIRIPPKNGLSRGVNNHLLY
ncbi:protein yellow-like [Anoplophora glabripennis]|uniref:protein yellow-like n=1 Tax=Anoplophora glabripennis TaxID=217634 RepID=UPI000873CEC9|nr:protein yellow-like [Anoplophora glabripennis]